MDRGPQHAGKAGVGYPIYGLLRGKIDQGSTILFDGTPQNPLSFAIIIVMCITENITHIVATITSSIYQNTKHGPTIDRTNRESIKGFPKGSSSYGNGALILGNRKGSHLITKVGQRSLSTSTFAANDKNITGEDLLSRMKVRDGKYYGLYKLICDENILFGAYHAIKSKPGNMTPGADGQTLDGFSKSKLENLSEELKTENFQFKPYKRF
jgi:hypothetical protein